MVADGKPMARNVAISERRLVTAAMETLVEQKIPPMAMITPSNRPISRRSPLRS